MNFHKRAIMSSIPQVIEGFYLLWDHLGAEQSIKYCHMMLAMVYTRRDSDVYTKPRFHRSPGYWHFWASGTAYLQGSRLAEEHLSDEQKALIDAAERTSIAEAEEEERRRKKRSAIAEEDQPLGLTLTYIFYYYYYIVCGCVILRRFPVDFNLMYYFLQQLLCNQDLGKTVSILTRSSYMKKNISRSRPYNNYHTSYQQVVPHRDIGL